MTAVRLTPAAARELEPGKILRDHEITGLELFAYAGAKSWRLYYRTRAGKERRPTIGHFPEMSLSTARNLARDLKERVARGEDPSAEWRALRDAPTVAELCDRYLKEWSRLRNAPRTIKDDEAHIERYIKPRLGHKRVDEVTRLDVDRFLTDVKDRRVLDDTHPVWVGKKEAPRLANHLRETLRKIFNVAREQFGITARDNPVKGSVRFLVKKRKRRATAEEMPKILEALERLEATHPSEAACLWILLLTGARVHEVVGAKTYELKGDKLIKAHHKTVRHTRDEKIIVLPRVAVRILERLPLRPYDGNRLFSHQRVRTAWERIRSEIGCDDLALLDFRRTFASWAASIGKTLNEIGQQLGHGSEQTTRGYSWILDDAKARTADDVAEHMLRAKR